MPVERNVGAGARQHSQGPISVQQPRSRRQRWCRCSATRGGDSVRSLGRLCPGARRCLRHMLRGARAARAPRVCRGSGWGAVRFRAWPARGRLFSWRRRKRPGFGRRDRMRCTATSVRRADGGTCLSSQVGDASSISRPSEASGAIAQTRIVASSLIRPKSPHARPAPGLGSARPRTAWPDGPGCASQLSGAVLSRRGCGSLVAALAACGLKSESGFAAGIRAGLR